MSATVHEASWRDVPGWDQLESGLDMTFKALAVRVVLLGLVTVTLVAPEAPGSRELFGWIRQILEVFALTAALWMAVGVGRCRAVPAGSAARVSVGAALALLIASIAAQTTHLLGDVAGLLGEERLATLRFLERILLLGAAASLLAAVGRAAVAARAAPLLRWVMAGQAALVAFATLYAVLFLSQRLAHADGASWHTILGLAAVLVVGLTLYPLHRLARHLSRAAAPVVAPEDVSLDAPYRVVQLAQRRRGRSDERPAAGADTERDPEPWIPRHDRLLGLHIVPVASPDRRGWVEARDGLRLYFGGLVARVAMALVASVAPTGSLGGGALAWFVALTVAIALAAGSLAVAMGAMRYRHIPRASGTHGLAQWAGLLATLVFLGDLLILLLLMVAAAGLVSPAATVVLGLVTSGLSLVAPLVLTWSLAVLGRTLGERALPRRARRVGLLGLLLGGMLVASVLLGASAASDVRGLSVVLGLAIFLIAIIATVQQLHLVHDAAESIDDHIARGDRAAEEPPAA